MVPTLRYAGVAQNRRDEMRQLMRMLVLALLTIGFGGCDLAQGIFKGGFIIGVIIAVIVVVLLMRLFGGRGKV